MSSPSVFVRVSGPPNRDFIIGYPGISNTTPRIEGTVEIRPAKGFSAAVPVSLVRICLRRRESVHPAADNVARRHLGTPRREIVEIVGNEVLLYRCATGRSAENVVAMDLPFILFIPCGENTDKSQRSPAASLQLPNRIAETVYELVVAVQLGHSKREEHACPIPLRRYDTLSTFAQYQSPDSCFRILDNVKLQISLPRITFGPGDQVTTYIQIMPNPDIPASKVKRVTIDRIALYIEEEITYFLEEEIKKVKTIQKLVHPVKTKLPEAGYVTNLALTIPSRNICDSDGLVRTGAPEFPLYELQSFSTHSTLYHIDFFLCIKASFSFARDITIRYPIVICPLDHEGCKLEMQAIIQAADDAINRQGNYANVRPPYPRIVPAAHQEALSTLGLCLVGDQKKPLID